MRKGILHKGFICLMTAVLIVGTQAPLSVFATSSTTETNATAAIVTDPEASTDELATETESETDEVTATETQPEEQVEEQTDDTSTSTSTDTTEQDSATTSQTATAPEDEGAVAEESTTAEATAANEGITTMSDDELSPMAGPTGSGTVHLINGDTGVELTTDVDLASTAPDEAGAIQTGWSLFNTAVGGVAPTNACTLDAITLSPGTYNKYFYTSGTTSTTTPAKQSLTFSGASSVSSGTGTTTFENMTIKLTGGSHLDCASGGNLAFKNCTINIDDTSYITSANALSFDGCTVNGSKGSVKDIQLTGGTCTLTGANTFNGCSIDTAKAASITTSDTTGFADCALTGTTDRTTSLVSVTAGTTTVSGTTTITGIGCTTSGVGGAVFNVTGGSALDLAGGTISSCNITAPGGGFSAGGAVAYVDNGTINLSGTTVSGCGDGNAGEWTCGPFTVAGTGTMNMTGGSITDCNGSHGGAVTVISGSGAFNMSGGSITGCTAAYDGGAVFTNGTNATVAMSGGTISGCSAKRTGSAIGSRSGGIVNISGGTITGNTCGSDQSGESGVTGRAAVAGLGSDNAGTVTLSGSPVISGNTNSSGAAADVMAFTATSLKIDNLGTAANVGITSTDSSILADGAQFAAASSGTASTTTNLYKLFNDSDTSLGGVAGTGGAVTWDNYVCQIRDDTTGTVLARYMSLADACAAVDNNQTIEMLQDVTQTAGITLRDKTFTITSVDTTSPKTINRGYTGTSLFTTVSGTNLTMKGITVDGQKDTYSSTAQGGILNVVTGSSFVMGSGCTIQNSKLNKDGQPGGGAILLSGTMEMHDGALGQGCVLTGQAIWGGFLYQDAGSTFTADGGVLKDNPANETADSGSSGAAIMQNPNVGNVTTTLGGTFSATGNSCRGNGSVVHGGGTGSVINIQGTASLTGNTCISTGYTGGAIYSHNATVNIQGSPTITGNTNTNASSTYTENVYTTAAAKLIVTGNLTGGEVGIYSKSTYKSGDVFGSTSTDPATGYSGLEHLTNDRTEGLVGSAGTGTNVIWAVGTAVCKIGSTPYATLQAAIDAVATSGTATIEMLVENYPMAASHTIASGKNITITTASETATDGYPYRGTTGTKATLVRSSSGLLTGSLFNLGTTGNSATTGALTLKDITVSGDNVAGVTAHGGLVYVNANSTLTCDTGATLKDSAVTGNNGWAGAICNAGTTTIKDGATISNCTSVGYVSGGAAVGAGAVFDFGTGTHTFSMEGGTITECGSATTPAVGVMSTSDSVPIMNMSGGTITDTPDSGYGAVYLFAITGAGTATLNLSGTASITGNSGAGVVLGTNGKLAMTDGTVTTNMGTGVDIQSTASAALTDGTVSGNTGGGVTVEDGGALAVSGAPKVTGNTVTTSGTTANQNVYLAAAASGKQFTVTGALSGADVGVSVQSTDHVDRTDFAFGLSYTATADDAAQFSDDTGALTVSLDSTTNAVQFYAANTYVCKIVDSNTGVATGYTTLKAAVDAVGASGTATIQMLVENYSITATHTIDSSKNITITTAKTVAEGCTDGLPYRGTTGTYASLNKATGKINLFNVSGGTLSLDHITLDGQKDTYGQSGYRLINVGTNGSVVLSTDCTLTNARSDQGTAIYASGTGATVVMEENSAITNCTSTDAGALDVSNHASFTMKDTSSITGCTGTLHASVLFLRSGGGASFNMEGDSTITGNTYSGGSSLMNSHGGAGSINLSGNASITGNTCTNTSSTVSVINLSSGVPLNLSGNASITNNTAPNSADGRAINAANGSTVNIQGNVVVDGNTNKSGNDKNLYTANNTVIKVTGDLGTDAKVGVYCNNYTEAGNKFGTAVDSSGTEIAAATYTNLDHFINDAHPNLYGMTVDATSSSVVWGKGTCQIIRSGVFIDTYETLAEATAVAQTGDVIQIYRSHELSTTATFPTGVTGVSITTAPTTQTVTDAYAYVPTKGDSAKTATVRRASTFTDGSLLTINTTGDSVDNVAFDGQSVSSSASAIAVNEDATFTNVTVDYCVNTGTSAAVEVASGKNLSIAGKINVSGNVDENGLAANIQLDTANDTAVGTPRSTGFIKILGDLTTGSSVGVTVVDADHKSYVPWAQAYKDATATTTSTTVAADSTQYFFDDMHPTLNIGANNTASYTLLDTYLYYEPPIAFSFTKVSNNTDEDPIEGAQFHVYLWKGAVSAYETDYSNRDTYLSDSALASDTTNWEPITTSTGNPKVFTSDANGVVDFGDPTNGGGLPDGVFRLVEINTSANHEDITAKGGWHFLVDSTQADPNKVTIPSGWANPLLASAETTGVVAASYSTTADTWVVKNAYLATYGQLKVFKHVSGDYADKTKAFSFSGTITGTAGTTYTGTVCNADGTKTSTTVACLSGTPTTFTLSDGQYLLFDALPVDTTFSMTETAATDYTLTFPTDNSWNSSQKGTITTGSYTASGTIKNGETRADFLNTYKDVPETKLSSDGGPWPWAGLVAIGATGLMAVVWRRRRDRMRGRA